jgi:hypothetical protein
MMQAEQRTRDFSRKKDAQRNQDAQIESVTQSCRKVVEKLNYLGYQEAALVGFGQVKTNVAKH